MIDNTPYFVQRACPENEHEMVELNSKYYCHVCKFTAESLRDVIGHDM